MSYRNVSVSEETFKMLQEAKKEFLIHHPEFEGKPITFNHIIRQAVEFYLK